jgi:shikimate dehydrogenase
MNADTASVDRYAVIGNPVAHSRSPQIHEAFAQATGQRLSYERLLGPLGGFAQAVDVFRAEGGRGMNVTVPFKLDAFAYATRHTERAQAAGAVNTLRFDADGTVLGDNTDGAGLVRDLVVNLGVALEGRRVLILGAGGATQGVVLPLLAARPAALVIANRTEDKAHALAARFAARGPIAGTGYDALEGRFDVVIDATSAGLDGAGPAIDTTVFAPGAAACEMIYGKGDTAFARLARAACAAVVADGLGMLVEQAAESFLLWRGVRPDTAPVLAQLRAAA